MIVVGESKPLTLNLSEVTIEELRKVLTPYATPAPAPKSILKPPAKRLSYSSGASSTPSTSGFHLPQTPALQRQ